MEKVSEIGNGIQGPSFASPSRLYFCSRGSGDLYKIRLPDEDSASGKGKFGEPEVILNTNGSPSNLAFDSSGVLYVADFSHRALLSIDDDGNSLSCFVKDYEGKGFQGPNSVVFDGHGTLFFTDSGPFGSTNLARPKGSVFSVTCDGELLQPLAHETLAHPSGLCLSPDQNILYVAETMNNRILRFVQKPTSVWHYSVFYQFSGGLGPTALATDPNGMIYVARFDFVGTCSQRQGLVSILSPDGRLSSELPVPAGPEISGLTFSPSAKYLYLTEASSNTLNRYLLHDPNKPTS